jgi:hypothetical protein
MSPTKALPSMAESYAWWSRRGRPTSQRDPHSTLNSPLMARVQRRNLPARRRWRTGSRRRRYLSEKIPCEINANRCETSLHTYMHSSSRLRHAPCQTSSGKYSSQICQPFDVMMLDCRSLPDVRCGSRRCSALMVRSKRL